MLMGKEMKLSAKQETHQGGGELETYVWLHSEDYLTIIPIFKTILIKYDKHKDIEIPRKMGVLNYAIL